ARRKCPFRRYDFRIQPVPGCMQPVPPEHVGFCIAVLLLSMPDYFEHMPPVALRMPNSGLMGDNRNSPVTTVRIPHRCALTHHICYFKVGGCLIHDVTGVNCAGGKNEEAHYVENASRTDSRRPPALPGGGPKRQEAYPGRVH